MTVKNNEDETIEGNAQTRLILLFAGGERIELPKGGLLFRQGEFPEGAYLVTSGRVKLSLDARADKELVARIVSAGDVLGLDAIFSGKPVEFTAMAVTHASFDFIRREELLTALSRDPHLFVAALQLLSKDVNAFYDAVRETREAPLRSRAR